MRNNSISLLLTVALALILDLGAEASDNSLLLHLPFNEGRGYIACDTTDALLEAELSNVSWATGKFGTAIYFNGNSSTVDLPVVRGLNGATQFTISLWTTWDNPEPRNYPNLLTSRNWSPGGMMLFVSNNNCSFRMGRPGVRAGDAGAQWRETGVPLLSTLPLKQWVHIGVTFDMPQITTYINGKKVAETTWEYPLECQALRLGGWLNKVCHQGLMSDLRIYSKALSSEAIAGIATSSTHSDAAYTIVEADKISEPLAASFKTRHAQLDIATNGRLQSLRSTSSGRELLSAPGAILTAELEDGRRTAARTLKAEGNLLHLGFARDLGTATVRVVAQEEFFAFKVESVDVKGLKHLTLLSLPVKHHDYFGSMANMLSDDIDGVCLRAYDLPVEMSISGRTLQLTLDGTRGFNGWRAGLAAGHKDSMVRMLQSMAIDAGVPISRNAGPWSTTSEAARGSYLFADLQHAATDDWIDIARRGGFATIHLHGWWETLGQYKVRKAYFPKGITDMQDSVARIQQAGMQAGIHTLTACISPYDDWVPSEHNRDLEAWHTYTLARDMTPEDTTIYVNEPLSPRHDVVFTYSGNGNAIRIGTEIIQYTELSQEPPYAFKGCTRGALKTTPTSHQAGAETAYLQQRYIAFYPKPDSPLADKLAECIGKVFNTCQLNQLYFDGSEGMMSRYGIDVMRHKIMQHLKGDPILEASCHGAHNWWFHSRLGAWDHPVWAAKLFQDDHIRVCSRYRKGDLLEVQMGWWAPRGPTPIARGHFMDEMEYFACKNMGIDGAMSIQGINVNSAPLSHYIESQFTLLGWYERLRLARYFDDATIKQIAEPGAEFRLRQEADGRWLFTPLALSTRRITTATPTEPTTWEFTNPYQRQPLSFRLEALYAANSESDSPAAFLLNESDLSSVTPSGCASGVKLELNRINAATPQGGAALQLKASNTTQPSTSAWARAEINFAAPYHNLKEFGAFGVWIKGDNSGAILNIQVASPREHMAALSEHYVDIDFEGWRYITLLVRERDTARIDECQWPYRGAGSHALFRTPLNMQHISRVALYLNRVPANGSSTVEVGTIKAMTTIKKNIAKPWLQIGAQQYQIPWDIESGQFVELDPKAATITLHSENGDPLLAQSVDPATLPSMQPGDNNISFSGNRAELTLVVSGNKFGTQRARGDVEWQLLDREYEMTRAIIKHEGEHSENWQIAVRPDESATIQLELAGSMTNPTLQIGNQHIHFPVTLAPNMRLSCMNGTEWQVTDNSRKVITKGALQQKIAPLGAGCHTVKFSCSNPDNARVRLVKLYQR